MSLPIKPGVIIATKLVSIYIYNFVIVFSLILGTNIAYGFIGGFNLLYVLISMFATFFIPLFPMAISSFVAFFLGFIPAKQKTKNIISTIMYILLFIGFGAIYFIGFENPEANVTLIYSKIGSFYFVGNWIYKGMVNGNIIQLLLFLIVSIGSFSLFVAIVSRFFLTINGRMLNNKTISNYNLTNEKYNKSSVTKTLFVKELRSLLNYPSVLIQILGGPIMSLIMCVMVIVMYLRGQDLIAIPDVQIPHGDVTMILLGVGLSCFLSMVSTTSSSISLEGKSFWIIKSAPIKTKDLFKAKCLVNIVLMAPVGIIGLLIGGIITKASILTILITTIFIISSISFATFTGLIMNIKYPKFDFDNPLKVVKQGKPILIMILIDFGLLIINILVMILMVKNMGLYAALTFVASFEAIWMVISYYLLFTTGVKEYDALSA